MPARAPVPVERLPGLTRNAPTVVSAATARTAAAQACARMEGCAPTAGTVEARRTASTRVCGATAGAAAVRPTARTEGGATTCSDCGGGSVCRHQRLRDHCAECNNFLCEVEVCPRQGHRFSSAQSLLGHMRSKHGDNPRAVTKSKELEVHQALRDALITFEYQHYLPFRGCGLESETAHAFADFALPTPWGYVLLEVDEEQRRAYDPSCDVRRDFDMAASVALGTQAAGTAPQPGRLQDRRRDAADHQEGAPRTADPPAGRAAGARAGGAVHPPLSLLRPGRGEQRAALRGGALVRA